MNAQTAHVHLDLRVLLEGTALNVAFGFRARRLKRVDLQHGGQDVLGAVSLEDERLADVQTLGDAGHVGFELCMGAVKVSWCEVVTLRVRSVGCAGAVFVKQDGEADDAGLEFCWEGFEWCA